MTDLVDSLASRAGISPEMARKGVGALLEFLKKQLGDDAFGRVRSAIPGAEGMVSEAESADSGKGGGLVGTAAGLAGKLLGGQAGAGGDLVAGFSRAGFGVDQMQAFLPKAMELLQAHLPPEILDRIKPLLPGAEAPAAAKAE